MMRKVLLLLVALCQILTVRAEFVTEQQAREKAAAFLVNHSGASQAKSVKAASVSSVTAESLVMVSQEAINSAKAKATGSQAKAALSTTAVTSSQPCYYIFNKPDSTGFVIVSAESTTIQILAYSNEGYFHAEDIDKGAEVFLNQYEQDVQTARTQGLTAEQQAEVEKLNAAITDGDKVYLETAKLSQSDGNWNTADYCPLTDGTQYAPAGCVATAMAIIMKYHGYPSAGRGYKRYTSTTNKLTLDRDFSQDTYGWSKIPMTAYSAGDWTDDAKAEIAKALRACGISVKMDYAYKGSASSTVAMMKAMVDNFSYAVNYTSYSNTNGKLASGWVQIPTEINSDRPVVVGGSGHCYVLDGYTSGETKGLNSGTYHYNMGWGGNNDGWYVNGAIGSSAYNLTVTEIITGIQKPTGTTLESGATTNGQGYSITDGGVLTITGTGTIPAMTVSTTVTECNVGENITGIAGTAFDKITFTKLTLPSTLTTVAANPFGQNDNLYDIEVAESNNTLSSPNHRCIYNKTSKTLISYCQYVPEITFPEDMTTIGSYAFIYSKSTKVEIPSGVTTLSNYAFYNGKLAEVSAPSSLATIGTMAFAYCPISKFTCERLTPPTCTYQPFYNGNGKVSLTSDAVLYVPYYYMEDYKAVTVWSQFSTITYIPGTEEGGDPRKLTVNVETAGTLASLMEGKDMSLVTQLIVTGEINGDDIKTLRALYPNSTTNTLQTLNLEGASIVSGGDTYFTDGGGKAYTLTESNVLPTYMFYKCKITNFILPKNITTVYRYCMPNGMKTVELPSTLTYIEQFAFYSVNITSLTIPTSVTNLDEAFVFNCSSLKTLEVASDNQNYMSKDNAIYTKDGKTILASYYVTDTLLVIPEGVETIGYSAYYLGLFNTVVLPASLKNVQSQNFEQFFLYTIVCKGATPPTMADSQLNTAVSRKDLYTVYVPSAEAKTAYSSAGTWSNTRYFRICEQGDLNKDGKFTIEDVTRSIQLLDNSNYNPAADMDYDGTLTVDKDTTPLVNKTLSK